MTSKINVYDFVQLTLLAIGRKIKGKTKLQKTMFFLGVMTDCIEELGYRAHFYGPYSNEVACVMNKLKALGFVDQNSAGGGAVNGFGFEVCRYDYRLNNDGKKAAQIKTRKYPDLWHRTQKAAKKFNNSGDLDYMELSAAAKIYYMVVEKEERATKRNLMSSARKLGWSLSEKQIGEATDYLLTLLS